MVQDQNDAIVRLMHDHLEERRLQAQICSVSITDLDRTPQKDKGSGIPSRIPGPKVCDSNYTAEGPKEVGTQLRGPLNHHRSGRQGVIHIGRSGQNQLKKQHIFFT